MQKIIGVLLVCSCMAIATRAQVKKVIRDIPKQVVDSLYSYFPSAKQVTWRDNLSNFQADFVDSVQNTYVSCQFSIVGVWQNSAVSIPLTSLQSKVKKSFLTSKYNSWEVYDIQCVTSANKPTFYTIVVRKGFLKKKRLTFDTTGKLLYEEIVF